VRRSVPERVGDIRTAIARCLEYATDLDSTEGHLAQMAVDAIERNIATIGEAVNHLPDTVTEALPGIDWQAIRGMRNILIHEYFGVENAVIRDVIETKLQPLDEALAQYVERRAKRQPRREPPGLGR
jgi:uncharacterized protein with HEPN domain